MFKRGQHRTQEYKQVRQMVRILPRKDRQTSQENLVEKTIEGNRRLNHMRKSNKQRQITATENQNGKEELDQDIIKLKKMINNFLVQR